MYPRRHLIFTGLGALLGMQANDLLRRISVSKQTLYHQTPEFNELKGRDRDQVTQGDATNAQSLANHFRKMFIYEERVAPVVHNQKPHYYSVPLTQGLHTGTRLMGIRALAQDHVHLQVLDDKGKVVYNTDAPYIPRHALPLSDDLEVRVRCRQEPTILVTYGVTNNDPNAWRFDPTSVSLMF
jgi:hypothetical protein